MSTKVLVAEDSGVMQKIISRALFNCGVKDGDIVTCFDGAAALEKAQAEDFALILTDWNMPKKTGLELLREIRESGANTPIIMVTTESDRQQVMEAVNSGVSGYLTKPFEQAELRELLSKFLQIDPLPLASS